MKIRDKRTGEIIDLAILRANLDGGAPWASAIIDALEAALSIAYTTADLEEDKYMEAHRTGFELALAAVHNVAGVIEESA